MNRTSLSTGQFLSEQPCRMKSVGSVEVLFLSNEPTLTIGSSYQADIYYQFNNYIRGAHAIFCFKEHRPFFRPLDMEGRFLEYGDHISIQGLNLQFLGKVLLVWANEGNLRVAFRDRRV